MSEARCSGLLLGALAGIPFGVLASQGYPWMGPSHFVAAGALAGAVLGTIWAEGIRDWAGRAIAFFFLAGALIGSVTHFGVKGNRALEGGCIGFALGIAVATALVFTNGRKKGGSPPAQA